MSGEANAYLADLRAENARLREVVRRVEGLADEYDYGSPLSATRHSAYTVRERIREALGSTDTGPAPAGAHAATQGAGNGV